MKTLVVIPTYNEVNNIQKIVPQVLAQAEGVVDKIRQRGEHSRNDVPIALRFCLALGLLQQDSCFAMDQKNLFHRERTRVFVKHLPERRAPFACLSPPAQPLNGEVTQHETVEGD